MSCCNEPIAITNTIDLNNRPDICGFNQVLEEYMLQTKRATLLGCGYGTVCSTNRFTVNYRLETPTLIRYDIQDLVLGVDETIFYEYVPELDTPNELFNRILKTQTLATDATRLGGFARTAKLSTFGENVYTALQRLNGFVLLANGSVNLTLDFKLIAVDVETANATITDPEEFAVLVEHYQSPLATESFKLMSRVLNELRQSGFVVTAITPIGTEHSYKIQLMSPFVDATNVSDLVRTISATISYTSEADLLLKSQLEILKTCPL